jgi:EmrB/QacA subfamily drug resistance transporter
VSTDRAPAHPTDDHPTESFGDRPGDDTDRAPAELDRRALLLVFLALCTGTLLAALNQTTLATALPTIVGELGGLDQLSWVVVAYLLTSTASTPLYGKISDIHGRRATYMAAISIFVAGSVLCGVAQDIHQLVAARAVQGVGSGGLMALAFAIIADAVSPRQRGRYVGILGSTFAVASVIGPLLGGFFVDQASWRWVFLINVPLGVLALVVTYRYLHLPSLRTRHRLDLEGAVLLVAGVSCLMLALVWAGSPSPWSAGTLVGLAAAGLGLSAIFLWWETRAPEPLLPLRLFSCPVISVSTALLFLVGLAMFGGLVFFPLFLQVSTGVSATASGLLTLPLMAGVMASSIASGRLITRTGRYKVWPIVGTAAATVGTVLLSTLSPDSPLALSGLYMAVLGAGLGMTMQPLMLAAQNAAELRDMGVVSSTTTFARTMGSAFGVAVFGAIFSARVTSDLPASLGGSAGARDLLNSPEQIRRLPASLQEVVVDAVAAATQSVFRWSVPLLVVGFVLAWFLRELPLRDSIGAPAATSGQATAEASATKGATGASGARGGADATSPTPSTSSA